MNPENAAFQALKTYGVDMVEQVIDPVFGRDDEINRMISVLSKRYKNSIVLVGDPGVGKTSIIKGLAQRIATGDVSIYLKGVRLFLLDNCSFVGGGKYPREFFELLKQVEDDNGKLILVIDGKTKGSMDVANLLTTILSRGNLRCIFETTVQQYGKYLQNDLAFQRIFSQFIVTEPSVTDTTSILIGLKEIYEAHHSVEIQDKALAVAAELSHNHIKDRYLPEKAMDLVDETCAKLRAHNSQIETITERHVADTVSKWTGLLVSFLLGEEEDEEMNNNW